METSKVLVSYRDPSKVFPSIAEELRSRLPLRKLNWNSDSRPFRSIPSLHVDFIPEHASNADSDTPDRVSTSNETSDASRSQNRRHQFPGLRQSPYLKIYFFRCDDVESYRSSVRKEIREWIQGNSLKVHNNANSSKQDAHDAFEWLLVQVVFDSDDGGSIAGSIRSESDPSKRVNSSRWTSRGSTSTVIEKIRADFNGTSKAATDRVAQIVFTRASNQKEGMEQRIIEPQGANDLLQKMKSLILSSLDLRVSQYEDDIKERELQRKVPGWNFNTFFVLKEGLARGFENVGLLEDALSSYKELGAELNIIVEDHGNNETSTSTFNDSTEEFREEVMAVIDHGGVSKNSESERVDFGSQILDTTRKDFRRLILENNISIFDFQCYVFARKTSLLLRIANFENDEDPSGREDRADSVSAAHLAKPTDHEPENLFLLAEVCHLADVFIASITSQMRKEFEISASHCKNYGETPKKLLDSTMNDLINSWRLSILNVVLRVTQSQTLVAQVRPILGQLRNSVKSPTRSTAHTDPADPFPKSALPVSPSKLKSSNGSLSAAVALDALRLLPPGTPHPGAKELAAERGNLIIFSRRLVSQAAMKICGWSSGVVAVTNEARAETEEAMEVIDLDQETSVNAAEEASDPPLQLSPSSSHRNQSLTWALQSEDQFFEYYEDLTELALAHLVVGDRKNAAEALIADIAINRYFQHDYALAASYFEQLSDFYGRTEWRPLEKTMLNMHAHCLKRADQTERYIRKALQVLSVDERNISTSEGISWSIAGLIESSKALGQTIKVPMHGFFDDVVLDPCIRHNDDGDGYRMLLTLRNMLSQAFESAVITIKIGRFGADGSSDMEISTESPQVLDSGKSRVTLSTRVVQIGWHSLKTISIKVGNIIFSDHFSPSSPSILRLKTQGALLPEKGAKSPGHFLVWAKEQNLRVQIHHSDSIDLRKPRSIHMNISSGSNNIEKGSIRIRSGSAGLRLDTADAESINRMHDKDEITHAFNIAPRRNQPGAIDFRHVAANSTNSVRMTYSLEHDLNEITVMVEISYQTNHGGFTYRSDCTCNIGLPLSVNVQDISKTGSLFSKFSMAPVGVVPLRLHSSHVQSNGYYEAVSPKPLRNSVDVFHRQPYTLITRIRNAKQGGRKMPAVTMPFRKLLHLEIEYHCLDQEIYAVLENNLVDFLTVRSMIHFLPLLQALLQSAIRSRKPFGVDMETICLLGKFSKGAFEDYGWSTVLCGLAQEDARQLEQVLREWSKDSPIVPLPSHRPKGLRIQHLTVPFDLPQTEALYTAKLTPSNSPAERTLAQSPLAVDQPFPVQLRITRARTWDENEGHRERNESAEFFYEVLASPDLWLIGGQRRAQFRAKPGESLTFEILLLPRTTGLLLYPSVEIAPVSSLGRPSGESPDKVEGEEGQPISYEVDYLNQAESVYVVPNLASTTVSLDGGNGGWLVESRSRGS